MEQFPYNFYSSTHTTIASHTNKKESMITGCYNHESGLFSISLVLNQQQNMCSHQPQRCSSQRYLLQRYSTFWPSQNRSLHGCVAHGGELTGTTAKMFHIWCVHPTMPSIYGPYYKEDVSSLYPIAARPSLPSWCTHFWLDGDRLAARLK